MSKTSVIDGIDDISYQVQSTYGAGKNAGQGIPGQYNTTVYQKTLVDTSKISVDTINQWANEAITNGSTVTLPGNNLYFKGTAANGLKFEGWMNSAGSFDSLYPVLNWQH